MTLLKKRISLGKLGFTIAEMMVAISVLSIVMAAVYSSSTAFMSSMATAENYSVGQLAAMDYLSLDLRRAASYSFTKSGNTLTLPLDLTLPQFYGTDGRTPAAPQRVLVTTNNKKEKKDHKVFVARYYYYYGTLGGTVALRYYLLNGSLYRKEGSLPARVIGTGISSVTFGPSETAIDADPVVTASMTFSATKRSKTTPPPLSSNDLHASLLLRRLQIIMRLPPTISRGTSRHPHALAGSALIATIMTITVLCIIAGTLLSITSSKQAAPFQAASWHEAGSAAEGGVEIGLNALRRTITEGSTSAWSGWETLGGTVIAKKYITENDLLSHQGEGNTVVRAIVEISAPTGAGTINPVGISPNRYAYLVRSTGLARVPGPSKLLMVKSDLALRKLNVFTDMRTASTITTPQMTRVVEALAVPVTPFPAAIMSKDTIEIKSGSNMIIDSYDPTVTPYKYDGTKTPGTIDSRRMNGNIASNLKRKHDHDDVIRLENVKVYGLAAKGKGEVDIHGNASVSGAIVDGFYRELKPVQSPADNAAFTPIDTTYALNGLNRPGKATYNIKAGNPGTPLYYKFSKIHLHDKEQLVIKKNGTPGGVAEVWVTGDFVLHNGGNIKVEDGANVVFYVERNITLQEKDASKPAVTNESVYATGGFTNPGAFQMYGVSPDRHERHVKIKTDMSGIIYAPDHEFEVKNKSGRHIYGALTGRKFRVESNTQLHYDEALADIGKPYDYTLESWQEDWFDPAVRTVAH